MCRLFTLQSRSRWALKHAQRNSLTNGVCRILISFFVQAWGKFLNNVNFEKRGEVGDSANGEEKTLYRYSSFIVVTRCISRAIVVRGTPSKRKGRWRDVIFDMNVESVHFIIAQTKSIDNGLIS